MGVNLILYDHLHSKVTFHVDPFSHYSLAELDKHSSNSDDEDDDTTVTSKVNQCSKANCDDKTNQVFQANPDS